VMPNCHRAMSSGSITQPSRTTTCCSTTNRSKEFPAHGYAKVLGRSHSAIDHTSDGGSAEPRRALPGREDHPPDLAFLRVPPTPASALAGRARGRARAGGDAPHRTRRVAAGPRPASGGGAGITVAAVRRRARRADPGGGAGRAGAKSRMGAEPGRR